MIVGAYRSEKRTIPASQVSLGDIGSSYACGSDGPGTIATCTYEPKEKKYGAHQLSLLFGTVEKFARFSPYREFDGLAAGSEEFDDEWKEIAEAFPFPFAKSQRDFMTLTVYDPVRVKATKLGFAVFDRAVQEALYSLALQHGDFVALLKQARRVMKTREPLEQVRALYETRRLALSSHYLLSNAAQQVLRERYNEEESVVTGYLLGEDTTV